MSLVKKRKSPVVEQENRNAEFMSSSTKTSADYLERENTFQPVRTQKIDIGDPRSFAMEIKILPRWILCLRLLHHSDDRNKITGNSEWRNDNWKSLLLKFTLRPSYNHSRDVLHSWIVGSSFDSCELTFCESVSDYVYVH